MPEYRVHWRGEGETEAGFQLDGFGPIEIVPWTEIPVSCGSYSTSFLSLEPPGVVYTRTIQGPQVSEWSNGIPVPEPGINLGFSVLACVLVGVVKFKQTTRGQG